MPKTGRMMQLFLTIVIEKFSVWRRCLWQTLCFFSIFLLENLVLVNSEKSWEVLELVQRGRSKFVLPRMISGGPAANSGVGDCQNMEVSLKDFISFQGRYLNPAMVRKKRKLFCVCDWILKICKTGNEAEI